MLTAAGTAMFIVPVPGSGPGVTDMPPTPRFSAALSSTMAVGAFSVSVPVASSSTMDMPVGVCRLILPGGVSSSSRLRPPLVFTSTLPAAGESSSVTSCPLRETMVRTLLSFDGLACSGTGDSELNSAPRMMGALESPPSKATTTSSPFSGIQYRPRLLPAPGTIIRAGADGASPPMLR